MDIAPFLLFALAGVLGLLAWRRGPDVFRGGIAIALEQAKRLSYRVPVAVLSAGFLAQIIPQAWIVGLLGPNTGFTGILVASVIGGFLPGGPMVAFPIALAFVKSGIGVPQLVALLTAWSVFALHRLLIYEIPLLGLTFSKVRVASALILPPIAGGAAWLAILLGWY